MKEKKRPGAESVAMPLQQTISAISADLKRIILPKVSTSHAEVHEVGHG
jgi:hypothetical protein